MSRCAHCGVDDSGACGWSDPALCPAARPLSPEDREIVRQTAVTALSAIVGLPYRCPYCVDKGRAPCPHGRSNGLNVDGTPLGPYGDDRGE